MIPVLTVTIKRTQFKALQKLVVASEAVYKEMGTRISAKAFDEFSERTQDQFREALCLVEAAKAVEA